MKLAPWVLVCALAVWLSFALRGEGYATDEARRLAAVNDSLRRVSAKVDTVYRTQRDTLWRRIARVDTLRESLTLTDTVEVIRFIAAQDSAIVACRAVVATCETRVSVRDERIAALEARGRALEAMQPTLRDKVVAAGVTLAVWEGVKAILGAAKR